MTLTRSHARIVAAAAVVPLLLAGCGGGKTGSTSGGGGGQASNVLTVAVPTDPEPLDPATLQLFPAFEVLQPMCEGLYKVDAQGALQPVLATGTETSKDGRQVTIKLRDGVKFNDGTEFNAEAVKASLERAAKTSPYFQSVKMTKITAVDATTVRIDLSTPYAPLLSDLAGPAGMVVSPKAVAAEGDQFGQSPVCVGPFKFKERQPGESVTMEKSTDYYDAAQIKLDGIKFRIIGDPNARLNAVRSGEVQVAARPDDTAVANGPGNGLTLKSTPTFSWNGFIVNVDNADGIDKPARQADTAMAKSADVRRAFSMALDRQALAQVGSAGTDEPSCSLISSVVKIHDTADCGKADPEGAKKLLEKAGVSQPVKVTIMASANRPSSLKIAQATQNMLKAAGFEAVLDQCEGMVCLQRTRAGQFDVALVALDGTPDPDSIVTPAIRTKGRYATHGLSDPKLDELLDQARMTNDDAKRKELYQKAMDRFRSNANIIVIATGHYTAVVSDKVSGVEVLPTYTVDVAHASISK